MTAAKPGPGEGYHTLAAPLETFERGAWCLEVGQLPSGVHVIDHFSEARPQRQRTYHGSRESAVWAAREFLGLNQTEPKLPPKGVSTTGGV